MLTTFLTDHDAILPFAFLALVVACAAVGWLLAGAGDRGRRWAAVLAVVALVPVLPLTLAPDSGHRWAFCTVQFSWPDLLAGDPNIAMLLPAAFFGVLATRRPFPVVAAGSGLSAAIELTQALLPALGRSCDMDDWEMNTVGVLTGALLAWGLAALVGRTIRSGAEGGAQRGRSFRYGSAALGAALVACVVLTVVHAQGPTPIPNEGACNGDAASRPTQLPDGITVYAGRGGGVCILTEGSRTTLPASASGPQLTSDDGRWSVGVARPGARHVVDRRGAPVRLLPVDGSSLRVWAAPAR